MAGEGIAPQGVGPEGADEALPVAAAEKAGDVEAAEVGGMDVAFMARVGRPPVREAQAGQTSSMLHLAMPNSVSTSSG
ncbi:hypothetical protein MASR2M50_12260 [Thauera sp.]